MKKAGIILFLTLCFLTCLYLGIGGFMHTKYVEYGNALELYEQSKRQANEKKVLIENEIELLKRVDNGGLLDSLISAKYNAYYALFSEEGFEKNGSRYENLDHFNTEQEINRINTIFSHFYQLPIELIYFITSCAFGVIGGIIRVVRLAIERKSLSDSGYFKFPIMGVMVGILVLGISYLLPTFLSTSETKIDSTSLMFLSLFGGLFSSIFFNRLESVFKDKLKS